MKKKQTVLLAAAICVVGAATASAAYWTDNVTLKANVSTLDVGIDYKEEALNIDTAKFIPGDSKDVSFTVQNEGDISVDIRPVITVESDTDMKANASTFVIVDADGEELTDYDVEYYSDEETKLSNEDVAGGEAYKIIKYIMNEDFVLSGSDQKEKAAGSEEELDSENEFSYKLKLAETTKNDFIGAKASIDVSTFAIQHRNREDGTGEWITGTEKIEDAETTTETTD